MVRYRVLGPIEVLDGDRLLAVGGPRQLALLALLLVHANSAVSFDRAIDALWGERREAGAVKRLQMATVRLRRALDGAQPRPRDEPALRTVRGGYLLAVPPGALDSQVFDAQIEVGRRTLERGDWGAAAKVLGDALALWRGPAFAEVAFEDFARAEIRRLEELRLCALELRIDADLQRGRHAELVGELEALVASHPERERLVGRLMLALYRGGRQSEALGAYQRARTYLAGELGLEPGVALTDLQTRILNQDPSLRLPAAASPVAFISADAAKRLIGRDRELGEVTERLEMARLVTLTGPGGIGKTRLALAVAERLRGSFPDGVFVIELAALEDVALLASTIARELGLAFDDAEPTSVLRNHLRDRCMLLVLDNFEPLLSAAPQLADLLETAPELRLLVTSRAALNLLEERLYEVPPLGLPLVADRLDPETVAASAAGALFVERARAVEPRFAINVENAQAVSEICERLDGLPLALELAASWVRLLGPHKLLARLDSRLALLTRGPRDLPVRQQSMRAAIAWSYQLLDPDTQRLFSRLGVFAGGWTLEAAEELCCEDVLHQLATLLDHSLVQQREGRRREPRFLMLETIREYALERLAAEGQLDTLRRRHAAWAHALVVRAETQMWGTGQEEWLDRLDDEHANLRAALGWSRQSGDGLLALELAAGANQFWWYRGHLAEGRDWLERALAHGADQPPALRAKALRGLTTIARLQGDYAYADERGREALTLSRQSNDLPGVVRALAYLSNVALARDRPARAAALLDESVALGREIGGTDLALPTLNRANLALSQRDYENTLELSREAAKLFRELGNAEGLATSLFNIASALLRQGRHVEALPSVLESLTLFERMGYDYGVALCLESVASVLAAEGSLIDAVRLLGAADALLQSSGATRELPEFEGVQSTVASLRRQLPTTTIEMEYAKGRSLTREQALALARRGAALHAQPGGDLRGSLAHR